MLRSLAFPLRDDTITFAPMNRVSAQTRILFPGYDSNICHLIYVEKAGVYAFYSAKGRYMSRHNIKESRILARPKTSPPQCAEETSHPCPATWTCLTGDLFLKPVIAKP